MIRKRKALPLVLGAAFVCLLPLPQAYAATDCADFSQVPAGTALPDFAIGNFQFHHIDGVHLSLINTGTSEGNVLAVNAMGLEIRLAGHPLAVKIRAEAGHGPFLAIGHDGNSVVGQFTVYPSQPLVFQDYEIRGSPNRLLIVGGGNEAYVSSICITSP